MNNAIAAYNSSDWTKPSPCHNLLQSWQYLLVDEDKVDHCKSTTMTNLRYSSILIMLRAFVNRGNAYSKKHEIARAIEEFNPEIELKPDFVEAYNGRGIADDERDEADLAIHVYTRVICD